MNWALKLGAIVVLWSLFLSNAFADGILASQTICVSNNSMQIVNEPGGQISAWTLAAGGTGPGCADPPIPATFVALEAAAETVSESVGDFAFNTSFTTPQGYYTIANASGGISDYIVFGNTSGTNGEVLFYSDPLPGFTPAGANNGNLCNEDVTGCQGSFTILTSLGEITVTAASDGEGPFDPFGLGQNISDGIMFAAAPEPSQLPIALAMLIAICGARRWLHA